MWGLGGRYSWRRRAARQGTAEGVVVAFAWISSQDKHLRSYVQLYESSGWNSLVCRSQFLDMFFPERALVLAVNVVKELVNELRIRPCPIVFASFLGGQNACIAKVLEVLEGKGEAHVDDIRLVRDCIAGFIFSSCPFDLTIYSGARFVVHPTVLKISHPPRFASWLANGIASGLIALFLTRFESQRAEYWQTIYSTNSMRVPYLILCSEHDDFAPYQTICNLSRRLQDLGGDVKLVTWKGSPHVGHHCHYPVDYKAAVTELLDKATTLYFQRVRQGEESKLVFQERCVRACDPIYTFREESVRSSSSSHGFGLTLGDQILQPSSVEYHDGKVFLSANDEHSTGVVHIPSLPSINAHGLLGQILFDACIPKNLEDWDIARSSDSYYKCPLTGTRGRVPFNPMKCIRRSRL